MRTLPSYYDLGISRQSAPRLLRGLLHALAPQNLQIVACVFFNISIYIYIKHVAIYTLNGFEERAREREREGEREREREIDR